MKGTPATDPRFDPRYQRGYDGPQPAMPSTPAIPSPTSSSPRAAGSRGEALPTESSEAAPRPKPETVVEPAAEAFWTPPRRNPYAVALLVAGVAMIAVGAWLIWTMATASSYPNGSDASQLFVLIQAELTPALLTGGIVGIVGWLVLGAFEASARKRD